MTDTIYTGEDVLNAVKSAVERFPDRQNPSDLAVGACVYTSHTDPDHHCIAGQVLVDLGLPVPSADSVDNLSFIANLLNNFPLGREDGTLLVDLFDVEAQEMLIRAQTVFDENGEWGICLDALLEDIEALEDFD